MCICTREMTLGEEIINLVEKGIDVPTVERMYRKYIDLSANEEARQVCREYCWADAEALARASNTILESSPFLPDDIAEGNQIEIPLGNLGIFMATAQVIAEDKVLFLFDDYVDRRPMNENGSNAGGYDESDLKKWIDTELYNMFPEAFKKRMRGLTIPTVGEICGWDDEWDREHFESDGHVQFPLMKKRRNRVAYYDNEYSSGWLRNAAKREFSSANFAYVNAGGRPNSYGASGSRGVRPEFWLVR